MSKKKNILIFADWFEPGYKAGGPIRSVTNLAKKLGKYHNVSVITSNRDLNQERPYDGIESNQWIETSWGQINYLDDSLLNEETFTQLILEATPEFIHLNSFFSPKFSLLPLKIARKLEIIVVLAPRGMLGAGALAIKKHKKKVFLSLVKLKGTYKDVVWHASTESEADEIRTVFGDKANIKVALNLVHLDVAENREVQLNRSNDAFKFIYLARVSKIKNLLFALECLAELRPANRVIFDIYGPIEDESYWNLCLERIKSIQEIEISYKGELPHDEVAPTFRKYNCLFLPTENENFGHVFLEAWSNGCQTLISDNTPWSSLEEKGVGATFSLTQKVDFVAFMQVLLNDFENEKSTIDDCLNFAKSIIDNTAHLNDNLNLFTDD